MKARLLSLRKSIATIFAGRKYATKHARCDAHMNELPVPCGPWDIFYKDRQAFYNQTLVAGFAWWLMSLVLMIYTGSIFFNWCPPDMPGPPSDFVDVDECEEVK